MLYPISLAVDEKGFIYLTDASNGEIYKFASDLKSAIKLLTRDKFEVIRRTGRFCLYSKPGTDNRFLLTADNVKENEVLKDGSVLIFKLDVKE